MLPTASVGAIALRYDFSGLQSINDVAVVGMVTIPISARREVGHVVAALQAREQIAQNRLDSSRRLIALEFDKRWDDLSVAWRAAEVADAAIEQSELNLREANDRYAAGLSTLSDVLEAEVLLHQAQDQRIDARRDYWLARAAYLRAVARDEVVWVGGRRHTTDSLTRDEAGQTNIVPRTDRHRRLDRWCRRRELNPHGG
jgi:outer membrane protein TolC